MLIELLILFILILINGVLSASEIAFISLDKFEIDKMVRKRSKNAKKIRKLYENSNNFLSTIQIGITLVGFMMSAFAASTYVNHIMDLGFFVISYRITKAILLIFVTFLLTYLNLVFGELIPKKIGLYYSYSVASFSINLINILEFLFYPIIQLLNATTDLLSEILGIEEQDDNFTEEDIKRIIISGTKDGIIEKKEQEYILNIFKFNDITVDKVMTPKEECVVISDSIKFEGLVKTIKKYKFTRYPVYSGKKDNIIGIFNVKEYIMYNKNNDDFDLKKVMFKVKKYNYNEKIDDVFANMQKEHVQMAIVIKDNEFIGVVTLEDAVEEILGNIYNEYDE